MPTPEMWFRAGFGIGRSIDADREEKREGREKKKAGQEAAGQDFSAMAALLPQVLGNPETTPWMLEHLARPDVSARVQSRVDVPPQFLGLGGSLIPPVTAPEMVNAAEGTGPARAEVKADPTFQRMQAAHQQGVARGIQEALGATANEAVARAGTGMYVQEDALAAARGGQAAEYRLQIKAGQERTGIAAEAAKARLVQKLQEAYMEVPEVTGRMYAQLHRLSPAALDEAEKWRQMMDDAADDQAKQQAIKAIVPMEGQIWRMRAQPIPDDSLLPHVELLKSIGDDEAAERSLVVGRLTRKPLLDAIRAKAGAPTTLQYKAGKNARATAKRLETQMWIGQAEGKWNSINDIRRWMHDVINSDDYKDAAPLIGRLGAELDAMWKAWIDISEVAAQHTGVPVTPATGQTGFGKMPGYAKGPRSAGSGRGRGKASGDESGKSIRGMDGFAVHPTTGQVIAVNGVAGTTTSDSVRVVNLDGSGNRKGYMIKQQYVAWPRTTRYDDIKLKRGMDRYQKNLQGMGGGGWGGGDTAAPAGPLMPEMERLRGLVEGLPD